MSAPAINTIAIREAPETTVGRTSTDHTILVHFNYVTQRTVARLPFYHQSNIGYSKVAKVFVLLPDGRLSRRLLSLRFDSLCGVGLTGQPLSCTLQGGEGVIR